VPVVPLRPLVVCLLFVIALQVPGGRAGAQQSTAGDGQMTRSGTWSAKSRAGLTLNGTWTAVADPKTGAVSGTWTLDARGTTVAHGGWSAAKSPKEWTGAWRANVSGSNAEHSGTWSASVGLKPNARFADLFELAVKSVVSGNWRTGRHSGGWSIRAADGKLRDSAPR
jgi:hypothetical protein